MTPFSDWGRSKRTQPVPSREQFEEAAWNMVQAEQQQVNSWVPMIYQIRQLQKQREKDWELTTMGIKYQQELSVERMRQQAAMERTMVPVLAKQQERAHFKTNVLPGLAPLLPENARNIPVEDAEQFRAILAATKAQGEAADKNRAAKTRQSVYNAYQNSPGVKALGPDADLEDMIKVVQWEAEQQRAEETLQLARDNYTRTGRAEDRLMRSTAWDQANDIINARLAEFPKEDLKPEQEAEIARVNSLEYRQELADQILRTNAEPIKRPSRNVQGREVVIPRAATAGQVLDPDNNPADRAVVNLAYQAAGGDAEKAAELLRKSGYKVD